MVCECYVIVLLFFLLLYPRVSSNAHGIQMAKSTSSGTETPKKKVSKAFAHLVKIAEAKAAKWKEKNKILPCILFLLMLMSWYFHHAAAGLTIGMLYSFPDNRGMSGRAGAWVYFRNGRIRRFAMPALVQNGYTMPVRALLANNSSAWNGLTDAQRLTWNDAEGFTRTDRWGVPHQIKGKNLFVMINTNLINIGVVPLTDAPLATAVNGITGGTLTATAAGTFSLAYTPTPTDATIEHLVYATHTFNQGVYRPSKSAFRLIGLIPSGTASPYVGAADYLAKFGLPILSGRVFIKVVPVNNVTGQAGPGFGTSDVVA